MNFRVLKLSPTVKITPRSFILLEVSHFYTTQFLVIPVVGCLYESAGPNICFYSQLPKKIAIVYVGR